jgi:tyrosinase
MSVFTITGVLDGRGPDGSVPLRLEIRDLQRYPDLWNLYILGLDRLQSIDQSELLSYYQLSGIKTSLSCSLY